MNSSHTPFTREDWETLVKLRAEGFGYVVIARKLKKHKSSIGAIFRGNWKPSVATDAEMRDICPDWSPAERKKKLTKIPCMNLECGKLFKSEGNHNRLCPSCSTNSLHQFDWGYA